MIVGKIYGKDVNDVADRNAGCINCMRKKNWTKRVFAALLAASAGVTSMPSFAFAQTYALAYEEPLSEECILTYGKTSEYGLINSYFTDDSTNMENDFYKTWVNPETGTMGEWECAQTTDGSDICIKANVKDGVKIDAYNFPDDVFRAYIADSFDTDGNGILSDEERIAVESIVQSNTGITCLDGIEYFPSLIYLDVSNNALHTLDLNGNTALRSIDCSYNRMEELYIDNCKSLTNLVCDGNAFSYIDLEEFENLQYFSASDCYMHLGTPECIQLNNLGISMDKVSDVQGATIVDGKFRPESLDTIWISYTYQCNNSFSETFTLNFDTASHTFEVTPQNPSLHKHTCSCCGLAYTEEHSFDDWLDNSDGTHCRDCVVCNYRESTAHHFDAWSDNADGTHSRTCLDCGALETEKHHFSTWSDNADGTHSRVCADCGKIDTKFHAYGAWSDDGNGMHSRICNDCNKKEIKFHSFDEWTADANGITHSRICVTCESVQTQEHNFGEWIDNGKAEYEHICSDCGQIEVKTMDYTCGDLNNDGKINIFDMMLMRNGLLENYANSGITAAADLNGDGKVSLVDVVKLQRYLIGRIHTI